MKWAIARLFGRRRMTLARFLPFQIQPRFSVAAAAVVILAASASTARGEPFARRRSEHRTIPPIRGSRVRGPLLGGGSSLLRLVFRLRQ